MLSLEVTAVKVDKGFLQDEIDLSDLFMSYMFGFC